MRILGRVFKNADTGGFYAVEVPALGVHTQGRTLKEAFAMAKDAVEIAVDRQGFKVKIFPLGDGEFAIEANNPGMLIATSIRRTRSLRGLSAKQVALRLGEKSETGILRYERGESVPSLAKFEEIMIAIDPSKRPMLRFG
ncbi:MAG TPA: type II toxin-antitoxin system HicB family antitoxin [Pseudobdellovibrionaceae bacterium]|nr:type II toxin-antitoxin system HicB family antitoxin [Pseudobdellovibrionaceae bacterium]